jgi:hypothetical protein
MTCESTRGLPLRRRIWPYIWFAIAMASLITSILTSTDTAATTMGALIMWRLFVFENTALTLALLLTDRKEAP